MPFSNEPFRAESNERWKSVLVDNARFPSSARTFYAVRAECCWATVAQSRPPAEPGRSSNLVDMLCNVPSSS